MKKFFIRAFAVITIIPAFIYFVSCFTPYISPLHFWPMAFLALGFPYLAIVILLLAFIWLFIRKKASLFLMLLFFAGYKNLFATFALNPSSASVTAKPAGSIRILTWNVRGFDNPSIYGDTVHSVRTQMFNYISKVDPDVLCLQEFSEHQMPGTFSNTEELKRLGYVYFHKTNEIAHHFNYGSVLSGTAIFSKIPFIDSGKVMLGDVSYPEYMACIDILLQNKTIRVCATHFKSINLFARPADSSNKIILYGDSEFVYQTTKFEKLKVFPQAHAKEALIAKDALNKSPFPVVLGTDMNSVPTSYSYHIMSGGLQDAFKLYGWGLGTTLDSLPKTLRIDFLFVDKKLMIQNYHKDELHLSDHFPQWIDVIWKE